MDQKISDKIRIIRIISMFMIVICHILQYNKNIFAFWLNVGVQIFFLISGILYGTKEIDNYKSFWKSRLKKIIIPYYLTIVPFFIVTLILHKVYYKPIDVLYYLTFSQAFNTNITSISHLWFISYILICYLMIPVLNSFDISKDKHFYLKLIALIVSIQALQFLNIHNINPTYVALFVTGFFFSRRFFKHKYKFKWNIIWCVLSFLTIAGIVVELYFDKLTLSFLLNKFFILYKDYVHAILGISLFLLFMRIIPSKNNKLIVYLADISYPVYLVHQIFIFGPYCVLEMKYGILILILLVLFFSNVLYYINKIINNRIIK